MSNAARHDAWSAGENYEAYMGRWSRQVAPRFLEWLGAPAGGDWLDVGCGTGALSSAILARARPKSLIGVELSEGFLNQVRKMIADPRAEFRQGDAQALPLPDASRDVVVSALVLNFIPDREKALAEMKRVARPGGTVAFYVWDYPGGGIGLMRAFWQAAAALDPAARELTEDRRFPFCSRDGLVALLRGTGFSAIDSAAITVPTVFRNFEDYWRPFTLGAGPAPGYCVSLAPDARERLQNRLRESLPRRDDGSIVLEARAWAARGTAI